MVSARELEVARALAAPQRLAILHRLLEGPAAVSELVDALGESQPNVSNHLAILRGSGLVASEASGRRSSYELAGPTVAQLVESLTALAGSRGTDTRPVPALTAARTCYDHLAGRLGVDVYDALMRSRALSPTGADRGDVGLGAKGREAFRALGVDLDHAVASRRRFAYACLDWTERRAHLGGALGAALCQRMLALGWIARRPGTRAVRLTPAGRSGLSPLLGDLTA